VLAADLPGRSAMSAAATQSPTTAAAFAEKSLAAAWKTAPSWYIVATADQVIPPEGQQFMARRAGAHTIAIPASRPAQARLRPRLSDLDLDRLQDQRCLTRH
jgi:hypothetical protein